MEFTSLYAPKVIHDVTKNSQNLPSEQKKPDHSSGVIRLLDFQVAISAILHACLSARALISAPLPCPLFMATDRVLLHTTRTGVHIQHELGHAGDHMTRHYDHDSPARQCKRSDLLPVFDTRPHRQCVSSLQGGAVILQHLRL